MVCARCRGVDQENGGEGGTHRVASRTTADKGHGAGERVERTAHNQSAQA